MHQLSLYYLWSANRSRQLFTVRYVTRGKRWWWHPKAAITRQQHQRPVSKTSLIVEAAKDGQQGQREGEFSRIYQKGSTHRGRGKEKRGGDGSRVNSASMKGEAKGILKEEGGVIVQRPITKRGLHTTKAFLSNHLTFHSLVNRSLLTGRVCSISASKRYQTHHRSPWYK